MPERLNGQIWIDKNSPNKLKYYVNGKEYSVHRDTLYKASADVKKGMVVKIDNSGNIAPAEFPNDILSVIGIASEDGDGSKNIAVLDSGPLTLNSAEINNVLYTLPGNYSEQYLLSGNESNYKGAPVYWFIGRSYKSDSSYPYIDPKDNKGKITLSTPSGLKWGQTGFEECFNIGYSNLPCIGTIADCKVNGQSIESLTINLSFSGFESELKWFWPLEGDGTPESLSSDQPKVRLNLRHGLFPSNCLSRGFCEVMTLEANKDTEYVSSCIVDNFYGHAEKEEASMDKRTYVAMNTNKTYRYNIHGTVVYGKTKGALNG